MVIVPSDLNFTGLKVQLLKSKTKTPNEILIFVLQVLKRILTPILTHISNT